MGKVLIFVVFSQKEREEYEVVIENGKLVYKESGELVETVEGSKWIFVLSTMRTLYIGKKQKGLFQHSSFLAGGAITAAGRMVAHAGVLEVNIRQEYVVFVLYVYECYRLSNIVKFE